MRACARYEGQRAKLRDKHRELTLPERLKGALTEFIKDSFTSMGEKYTLKNLPTFFEEPELPDIDSEDDSSDAKQ